MIAMGVLRQNAGRPTRPLGLQQRQEIPDTIGLYCPYHEASTFSWQSSSRLTLHNGPSCDAEPEKLQHAMSAMWQTFS